VSDNDLDLDALTRGQLAELDGPAATVADVLDDWIMRRFGKTSSHHGAGLFLELLAAEGYRVEKISAPELSALLPPEDVHDGQTCGFRWESDAGGRTGTHQCGNTPHELAGQHSCPCGAARPGVLITHAYVH
jgi:hypothetical protein